MASKKKTAKKAVVARPAKKKATAKKRKTTKRKQSKRKKAASKAPSKGKCFVMMPFSAPFDLYYEHIYKGAIADAELEAIRADDLFRPSPIVADLWEMVLESTVLLAELTTKNANVFYELGLAHAVGLPVVLVSETMDDVPFDLQPLRVLLYNKDVPDWGAKLGRAITSSLRETLADPIKSVPSIFRKKVEGMSQPLEDTETRLQQVEAELRRLRLPSTRKRLLSGTSPEDELRRVGDPEEFETWVRTWHSRGLPGRILQQIARKVPSIPNREARRIPEILDTST